MTRLTSGSARSIREDPSRKPIYNESSTAAPGTPSTQKRPLSNHAKIAPSSSLSELKTLNLGGRQREGDDVPMRDISDDAQAEKPRKRAAIGDGISAGSASPFRDSESPPPQRPKARPTSAPYGSTSETEMRRPAAFEEIRPPVSKKTLWTPEHDLPLTRSSFDLSNIASIQTQKSRNQALQSKSRKPYQLSHQVATSSRLPNPQSPQNAAGIVSRPSNQSSQSQLKDEGYDIVLQPETRPISQEQLVAEVKGSKLPSILSSLHLFGPLIVSLSALPLKLNYTQSLASALTSLFSTPPLFWAPV